MRGVSSYYWNISSTDLLLTLQTTTDGLDQSEAERRRYQYGLNVIRPKREYGVLNLLWSQFKSPITLILIFAAVLSLFLHEPTNAIIVLVIVAVSGLLSVWQEHRAMGAVHKLISLVQTKVSVLRNGSPSDISIEEIVPGDIILLRAGDIIPGDCVVIESRDLFVDEAVLTGETFPSEKVVGVMPADSTLEERKNALFLGTHVVSGSAKAVVVTTGKATEFGKIAHRLELRPPETDFERGVRRFGFLLMEITLILVITIFAINVYLNRPILDSLLFSLALAVGLTPQLLPSIISVNLAHGARRMAQQKVIVKRLSSIEDFGSMNVLCSDKTGTLTEGKIKLQSAQDIEGNVSEKVLLYACLNAAFETGYLNPIDEVLRQYDKLDISGYRKLDEIPYDFVRKRLTVLVSKDESHLMLTKGAASSVLSICSKAEKTDHSLVDLGIVKDNIEQSLEELSRKGFRTLGISYRILNKDSISRNDEADMTFLGFIVFFDPPKMGIPQTLRNLEALGISLKIITGDNRLVAEYIAGQVGISIKQVLTGGDLHKISDEALLRQVNETDIFAEVEPNHKERIILALMKTGNVVGYLGDGINDASALHAADVGISVESAVDVAKEAADIVLLDKDINVLVQGIEEGRKTFANTLKYVFMATSANFGNMFSMAGVSLILPFLPLLPKQILLTNLLTDFPEMSIATDSVDRELVDRPRRWNIAFIRKFMITFGLISSVFDYLTFALLVLVLHAGTDLFRTGWFIESVISASVVVLVIRSRRFFFRSKPSRYLLLSTMAIVVLTLAIPYTPLSKLFGFTKPSPAFLLLMIAVVLVYVFTAEFAKRLFYRHASL